MKATKRRQKAINQLMMDIKDSDIQLEQIDENGIFHFHCEKCDCQFQESLRMARLRVTSVGLCPRCHDIEIAKAINDYYKEIGSSLHITSDLKKIRCVDCGHEIHLKVKPTPIRIKEVSKFCKECHREMYGWKPNPVVKNTKEMKYILVDSEDSEPILQTTNIEDVAHFLDLTANEVKYIVQHHLRFKQFDREFFIIGYRN